MNHRPRAIHLLIILASFLTACEGIPDWVLNPSPGVSQTSTPEPMPTTAVTATPIDNLIVTPQKSVDQPEGAGAGEDNLQIDSDPRPEICSDAVSGSSMTYSEALQLAQESDCAARGSILLAHFCNPETGSWWLSLKADAEGCNPACIVNVNDSSVEINWRCTGSAVPPQPAEQPAPPEENGDATPQSSERFFGWQGLIFRQPHGALVEYRFLRDDGLWFNLKSEATDIREQFAVAAWTGDGVSMTGEIGGTPGLLDVDRILLQDDHASDPRDLTPFAMASASSVLPVDTGGTYSAWSAVDGASSMPWCEGADESGSGEWIQLDFTAPVEISEIRLNNGFDSGENLYDLNGRLHIAEILIDGQSLDTWYLDDERGVQTFPLASGGVVPGVTASSVRIVILDAYPGLAYPDTCIGEVAVWGRPAE